MRVVSVGCVLMLVYESGQRSGGTGILTSYLVYELEVTGNGYGPKS
jgi:hypothetical protein